MQQTLDIAATGRPGRDVNLVTVSQAAELLGVNKSTVSRQVGRLYPNRGTEKRPLIDINEARTARSANLNPAMRRVDAIETSPRSVAVTFEEDPPRVAPTATAAPAGSLDCVPVATLAQWQTEKVKEQALLARAQREEKAGLLVERQLVDETAFEFGRMLADYLGHLASDLSVTLASMLEPREIALYLDQRFRQMQERLAAELERRLGASPEASAAEEELPSAAE
ncbi:hypothetical protein N825_25345 [Skermanella stibiiresistens SB22]|uniref:Uncharacterized protein n=1 Tax=Skermanella stibiiresistens SB22 TaxID=1385369 RepID=W9GWE1_9PROT|nr:hypothetical protein [Skermanella stibiiresistens]EWY36762.1 hypothetical protein N825_25345 [Skermanella stibiiresistens SB22]